MRKLSNKRVVFFDMGNTLLHFHSFKNKEKQAEIQGFEYLYQFLLEQYPTIKKEELIEGFIAPWQNLLRKRKESFKESNIDELLNAFVKHKTAIVPTKAKAPKAKRQIKKVVE